MTPPLPHKGVGSFCKTARLARKWTLLLIKDRRCTILYILCPFSSRTSLVLLRVLVAVMLVLRASFFVHFMHSDLYRYLTGFLEAQA